MKTVLCFGTFDGLHPGHEHYFSQAKKIGDRVVVVVARDATVLDVKGQLPLNNQEDRRDRVSQSLYVDQALLGHEDDKYKIIEEIKPHFILLGYDQEAFTDQLAGELERRGIEVEILRADPLEPERYKSHLLNQIDGGIEWNAEEDEQPL